MDGLYTIEKEPLGYGIQGPVMKAVNKNTGQNFARKMLGTAGVSEPTMKDLKNELVPWVDACTRTVLSGHSHNTNACTQPR